MAEHWTDKDSALLLSALGATVADAETTKHALAKGAEEKNPLLGSRPSNTEINLHGALAALGITAAATQLPIEQRRVLLGALTGFKAGLAAQNRHPEKITGFMDALKKPALIGALAGLLAHQLPDDGALGVVPTKDKGIALSLTKRF